MNESLIPAPCGPAAGSLVAVPGACFPHRRDLIIGVLVSAAAIFGGAWISQLTKGDKPILPPKDDLVHTLAIVLPPLEPDRPDVVEDTPPPRAVLAPPTLNDLPELITPDAFVQPLQPPLPDDVSIDKNLVAIPVNPTGWIHGVKVFDPSQLDQQPVPTVQARPNYPFELRRDGISGQVVVDFIVDASGRVQNAFAASSSHRDFEPAAVQAVSKWQFRAGRRGGSAVNTHMQVPIVFTLNANE
jgi:protein TonB